MSAGADFMASQTPIRIAQVSEEARQPLPVFDDEDDVMNYMVTEAVVIEYGRYKLEQEKQRAAKQEQDEWKQRPVGSGPPPRRSER